METEIETKKEAEEDAKEGRDVERMEKRNFFFYCLCLLGVYCILLLLLHFLFKLIFILISRRRRSIPTIIYTNKISDINVCIVCT